MLNRLPEFDQLSGPVGFVFAMKLAKFFRWTRGDANFLLEQCFQCLQPQHLALENASEIARDRMSYFLESERVVQFVFH